MSSRLSLLRWLSIATILLQISLMNGVAFAQSAAFNFAPIVKRGDPAPGGGSFFDCDLCLGHIYGWRALNNHGVVAINANTTGPCFVGNFLVSADNKTVLANACNPTNIGQILGLGRVNINDSGAATFYGSWSNQSKTDDGIVYYSQGQFVKVVAIGDPSPNGAVFKPGIGGFSQPSINNAGDITFGGACEDSEGNGHDGIFLFSGGQLSTVVQSGDPSPIGGELALGFLPPSDSVINNNNEVLFQAWAFYGPFINNVYGLFLVTKDGVRKIVTEGDPMPNGDIVYPHSLQIGDLNDKGEVAFTAKLKGKADTGIFVNSGGTFTKIMAQGDASPIGGTFSTLEDPDLIQFLIFVKPRINNNGAVLFKAKVDNQRMGLFLASPKAMIKVVAVGDQLPGGGRVRLIDSFALNDNGQVAFFAYGKKDPDLRNPLGAYMATPLSPQITSVKLKHKKGSLQLRVNGNAMITNDTVIEINGVPVGEIDYPADFKQDGGFTTQVISRDPQLEQLMTEGQTVQVTVFNSLTNLRSAPVAFKP